MSRDFKYADRPDRRAVSFRLRAFDIRLFPFRRRAVRMIATLSAILE